MVEERMSVWITTEVTSAMGYFRGRFRAYNNDRGSWGTIISSRSAIGSSESCRNWGRRPVG